MNAKDLVEALQPCKGCRLDVFKNGEFLDTISCTGVFHLPKEERVDCLRHENVIIADGRVDRGGRPFGITVQAKDVSKVTPIADNPNTGLTLIEVDGRVAELYFVERPMTGAAE